MGNCRGGGAICSRGWLASPPLVLLPQQEVTELLELAAMDQAHPISPGARKCELSSVLLLCPSFRVSRHVFRATREGIPDGMCWPTWLVVVEVLARKPRARARPLQGPWQGHWVVLNGISGQSGSTERHVLASHQGALDAMSMAGSYI